MIIPTVEAPPDRYGSLRPFHRLAGAVLIQAIEDLFKGTARDRRESLEWLENGKAGTLSFEMCCMLLDRDPEDVRTKLIRRYSSPRMDNSVWSDTRRAYQSKSIQAA